MANLFEAPTEKEVKQRIEVRNADRIAKYGSLEGADTVEAWWPYIDQVNDYFTERKTCPLSFKEQAALGQLLDAAFHEGLDQITTEVYVEASQITSTLTFKLPQINADPAGFNKWTNESILPTN